MEYKTIINNNGDIVDKCVLFINGMAQNFEIEECQEAVVLCTKNFIKPHWDDQEWTEGATEEEIKVWQEENMVVEEPSEDKVLLSNILLENATLKQQMAEQQELTASLLLQIAELKGGNTNV